jgi:hypothetical protein
MGPGSRSLRELVQDDTRFMVAPLHSRDTICPSCASLSAPKGRGECRVPIAPAASRGKIKTTRASPPQVHRDRPAFPHANGFNGFLRALLGEPGLLSPSLARSSSHRLNPSVGGSGPHDFAVREVARSSSAQSRVHRVPPNVRDDGQRPFFGRDRRICRSDLPVGLSEIFL